MSNKRNSNIEILRILLMLLIIMHHCIINGYGLQDQLKTGSSTSVGYSCFLIFLNAFAVIGVNVFFIISGYFSIKFSLKKLIRLVIDLYLYADILILISVLTGMEKMSLSVVKNLLLPFYKYWFIWVYLLLMIISPILNAGIEALKKRHAVIIGVFFTALFCVLGFVSDVNLLGLENGYSLMFAMYLYYIGRVIKKFDVFVFHKSWKNLIMWIVCSLITFLLSSGMLMIGKNQWAWKMFSYNQLFLFFSSVFLFGFFITLPQNKRFDKVIRISKHILPVYYIHTAAVIAYYRNIPLKYMSETLWIAQFGFLLLYAVAIFIVCVLIDVIKEATIGRIENKFLKRIFRQ